jgi:hypothetical protein
MRHLALLLACLLSACAEARFDPIGQADAAYTDAHPLFAEYCAVSQILKVPGFGADIRGNIGGHAVFYLQGACKDADTAYPVLRPCDTGGAGLSMNEHFSNAKWVATPGDAFFFDGDLPSGAPLTADSYRAVQRRAQSLGIYKGVTFHDVVFKEMPPDWTREDWKYEMSVGTDYAISLGRARHCTRIPVDRPAMNRMIDFLNAENAPYRAGKTYVWDLFRDNCIHLAHNALAAAGLWDRWPTNRPFLISVFDFPTPRNEFVNLVQRTNDHFPADPGAAYDDPETRRSLLMTGEFPTSPGSLALSRGIHQPNALYEPGLTLIFYDEPLFGHYQRDSDTIFATPRYFDPAANRAYFAGIARAKRAEQRPLRAWLDRPRYASDPATFTAIYDRYYALMSRYVATGVTVAAQPDPLSLATLHARN